MRDMKVKINGWVSSPTVDGTSFFPDSSIEVIATEERKMKERQAQHEAEMKTVREAEERAHHKH
jgi:hypothetical protein